MAGNKMAGLIWRFLEKSAIFIPAVINTAVINTAIIIPCKVCPNFQQSKKYITAKKQKQHHPLYE